MLQRYKNDIIINGESLIDAFIHFTKVTNNEYNLSYQHEGFLFKMFELLIEITLDKATVNIFKRRRNVWEISYLESLFPELDTHEIDDVMNGDEFNILCKLFDDVILSHLNIDDAMFIRWGFDYNYDQDILTIKHCGDFRILDWHRRSGVALGYGSVTKEVNISELRDEISDMVKNVRGKEAVVDSVVNAVITDVIEESIFSFGSVKRLLSGLKKEGIVFRFAEVKDLESRGRIASIFNMIRKHKDERPLVDHYIRGSMLYLDFSTVNNKLNQVNLDNLVNDNDDGDDLIGEFDQRSRILRY